MLKNCIAREKLINLLVSVQDLLNTGINFQCYLNISLVKRGFQRNGNCHFCPKLVCPGLRDKIGILLSPF